MVEKLKRILVKMADEGGGREKKKGKIRQKSEEKKLKK